MTKSKPARGLRSRQNKVYVFVMRRSSPSAAIFSQRLRSSREIRNLNQAELAKKASFQVSAISHFESQTRKPSFENLQKLADALSVTTDYLLGRTDNPEMSGMSTDQIFRDFQMLTADDQDLARDLIRNMVNRRNASKTA